MTSERKVRMRRQVRVVKARRVGQPAGGAIVHLRELQLAPDVRVVALAHELLARAESGELVSIAVAAQIQGGGTLTSVELGDGDRAHLHFAMCSAAARLLP